MDKNKYEIAYTQKDGVTFWKPVKTTDYHLTRVIEATKHSLFSSLGLTKDTLQSLMNEIINRCNKDGESAKWRTDVGALANMVLYAMANPLDEHCAMRLGACLVFMEDENPDAPSEFWENKKYALAFENPDTYAFFLTMGINASDEYRQLSEVLKNSDYFRNRKKKMNSLITGIERLTIE